MHFWIWISIALGLLVGLVGVVATVSGALEIGLLLAVATSGAFSAATWFYGNNEGWLKNRKLLVSGLTFVVLALTLPAIAYYMLQPPSPIAIVSSEVELSHLSASHKQMRGYIDIDVYNRGDDPHYDVWVKLLITSELLMPETIDIDFPTIEERASAGDDVLEAAVSSMCLGGRDNYKHPAFLCVIDELKPKGGMFKIKLTSRLSIDSSSPASIGHLSATVVKFFDRPGKHYDHLKGKQLSSAAEHPTPEPFETTTMFHYCPAADVYNLQPPMRCTPNSRHNIKDK